MMRSATHALALAAVLAGGAACSARVFRPVTPHAARGEAIDVDLDRVWVLGGRVGDEVLIRARVQARAPVGLAAGRLAAEDGAPCTGGVEAHAVELDGLARPTPVAVAAGPAEVR